MGDECAFVITDLSFRFRVAKHLWVKQCKHNVSSDFFIIHVWNGTQNQSSGHIEYTYTDTDTLYCASYLSISVSWPKRLASVSA